MLLALKLLSILSATSPSGKTAINKRQTDQSLVQFFPSHCVDIQYIFNIISRQFMSSGRPYMKEPNTPGKKWAASCQNQRTDCAPSEDSAQPGHPPSLIRIFAVRMKKAWVLSYPLSAQRRLWSDWADVQADLSLRWAHSDFVDFVMRRLKYIIM